MCLCVCTENVNSELYSDDRRGVECRKKKEGASSYDLRRSSLFHFAVKFFIVGRFPRDGLTRPQQRFYSKINIYHNNSWPRHDTSSRSYQITKSCLHNYTYPSQLYGPQ